MKIKVLLVIALMKILGVFPVLSNGIYGVYSLNKITLNTDCDIYFYPNGRYEIFLTSQDTDDIVSSHLLSLGEYTKNEYTVNLYDEYHGYEQEFLITNKGALVPKKSFAFLLGKTLIKTQNSVDNSWFEKGELGTFDYNSILLEYENPTRNRLYFGVFYGYNDITLKLEKTGNYNIKYRSIIVSEAVWQRKGNVLDIVDKSLKANFSMIITAMGNINCGFFSGKNYGLTFGVDAMPFNIGGNINKGITTRTFNELGAFSKFWNNPW